YALEIKKKEDLITIQVTGSGFLYNMVRILAGTLIEVGRGRRQPEDMKRILEGKDRSLAGPTAPAKGLRLLEILIEN
ncbi:MAG: tRNA pseudouridine(38-40) synthase TruA, partial [Acetivibrio sp.]